jgi:hypothetical protein
MKRNLGGWLWSDVDGSDDEYEYRYFRVRVKLWGVESEHRKLPRSSRLTGA